MTMHKYLDSGGEHKQSLYLQLSQWFINNGLGHSAIDLLMRVID